MADPVFPASAVQQLRDYCYVDDTVRGIFHALTIQEATGEVFNIASGQAVSIRTMIEKVCTLTGFGKPHFGKIPYRPRENMNLIADISKAKKILKWDTKISLEEGITRTLNSFDKHG